jgi:glycolate oxidase iron-sulfur subunit
MLGAAAGKEKQRTYLQAFDQCIGCRACEAACPSGVPFSLLEHGQHLARGGAAGRDKAVPDEAVPGWVVRRLDSAAFLRGLRVLGAVGRAVLRSLLGDHWRRRLAGVGGMGLRLGRLLGSLPTSPVADEALVRRLDGIRGVRSRWTAPAAAAGAAGDVLFFTGCANDGLLPGTSRRLQQLLRAAGCRVVMPTGQTCCGALAGHTGRPGRQAAFRRTNREVLAGEGPIVVEAAGCGLELKNDGPAFAARIVDASQLLERLTLPRLARLDLKVAVHDPCHARHGQGIVTEPRALLDRIPGVTVLEPAEAEVCCGAGGAWGLRYPELSAELGTRKARHLVATGADLIVTTNPGCLGQIADGLLAGEYGIPIMPLSDLLWYAAAVGAVEA